MRIDIDRSIDPLKHVLNCIFILRKSFSGIDSKPWPVEVQSAAKCHFHMAKIVFKHQNGRNACKARPIGQKWFRCAKISFGFNHCKAMMLPSFAVKGKVLSWTAVLSCKEEVLIWLNLSKHKTKKQTLFFPNMIFGQWKSNLGHQSS